jgi:O-antigen/teichoic acid export membrane protein
VSDEAAALSPRVAAPRVPPLGSSALAVTVASALFVVAGYAINVALGRALGPVDYGLFGVVIGLMTVVNALQTSAIPQAIAKFAAEHRYELNDLLVSGGVLQMGTGLALALLLFVLADVVAGGLNDARLAGLMRIAALAFPSYALLTLLIGIENGRGHYLRQAFMLSVYSVVKAALAVGLGLVVAVPGAITAYVLAPLAGAAVAGAVPKARQGRRLPLRPFLSYAIPLLLLAALSMAYLNLDLFLVK